MNKFLWFFVGLVLLTGISFAGETQKEVTPDVKEYVLDNGLTVLILERHDSPTVACYRFHKVGSVNEWYGMTGASHLLEHMMFKGTSKIGTWNYEAEKEIMAKIEKVMDEIDRERAKGLSQYQKMDKEKIAQLWEEVEKLQKEQRKYIKKNEVNFLYTSHGGRGLNASTGYDSTDYYVLLPSNRLELWAFIESERMQDPVFREFYSERNVVYEERRMRTDNRDWGKMLEQFMATMFQATPYHHPIVGFASDIETMRKDQVMDYLKKYYSPNNTIITLVGDVDAEKSLQLIKKYFGDIPRQPDPKPVFTQDAPQQGERRIVVKFDAEPMLLMGYHGPKPGEDDQYVLQIIAYLLSDGRTSLFYKNLVKSDIAYEVDAWQWDFAYANAFMINGIPKAPYTVEDLETAIYKEIERLKTEPVSQKELDKVHNKLDMKYINRLKTNWGMAILLSDAKAWKGDWRKFDERDRLKKVTPEDIKKVANKYLIQDNRTVATLVKKEKENVKEGKDNE